MFKIGHRGTVHSGQNLEATFEFIDMSVNLSAVGYSRNEILCNSQNEVTSGTCHNQDEFQQYKVKNKFAYIKLLEYKDLMNYLLIW